MYRAERRNLKQSVFSLSLSRFVQNLQEGAKDRLEKIVAQLMSEDNSTAVVAA
jgi:hypothetical protein